LYQYRKAVEHSDFYLAKLILEAQTAKESKSISKHIKTSQQWFYSKQNIMLEVLAVKFTVDDTG
jgi:predicted NAD-dependent protein-ADP-ribosyltransferase YbiA (DUF1768 family)